LARLRSPSAIAVVATAIAESPKIVAIIFIMLPLKEMQHVLVLFKALEPFCIQRVDLNQAAAQREARLREQGSPLPIRHMRAAMPDGINQTAKRSVTRMSDNDPRERRKTSLTQTPN
ncbi:hypothetical protein, partial [Pseudogemmobacter sp. W21_MBD1_M6]|uniref:hypothetical protein n=1 Tax=Pseudogemmobacter sp. W21_MBD1_M6 TaxID=3240271 RepID=UPI003F99016C